MTANESPRFLQRMLIALGNALKRGVLGKSTHEYMKQLTGSDQYWDRAIAAQLNWPQKHPSKPDPDRSDRFGDPAMHAGPGVRGNALCPPEFDYEPVHGWTKRQCDDYLARNPGYGSTYEAALQVRPSAGITRINGSPRDWFVLWRIHHDKAASNTEPNGAK